MSTIDSVKTPNTSQQSATVNVPGTLSDADDTASSTATPLTGFKSILGGKQDLQNAAGASESDTAVDKSDTALTAQDPTTDTETVTPPGTIDSQAETIAADGILNLDDGSHPPGTLKGDTTAGIVALTGATSPAESLEPIAEAAPGNATVAAHTSQNNSEQGAANLLTPAAEQARPAMPAGLTPMAGNPDIRTRLQQGGLSSAESSSTPIDPRSLQPAAGVAMQTATEGEADADIPVQMLQRPTLPGNVKAEAQTTIDPEQTDEITVKADILSDKKVTGADDKPSIGITAAVERRVAVSRQESTLSGAVSPTTATAIDTVTPGTTTGSETSATPRLTLTADLASPKTLNTPAQPQSANHTIKMMLSQGINSATVNLHPAELGSMRINIEMRADQLQVQIVAVQPATRDTIEAALPRLREQLEMEGYTGVSINLDAGGAQDSPSERTAYGHTTSDPLTDTEEQSVNEMLSSRPTGSTLTGTGLVDLFA